VVKKGILPGAKIGGEWKRILIDKWIKENSLNKHKR